MRVHPLSLSGNAAAMLLAMGVPALMLPSYNICIQLSPKWPKSCLCPAQVADMRVRGYHRRHPQQCLCPSCSLICRFQFPVSQMPWLSGSGFDAAGSIFWSGSHPASVPTAASNYHDAFQLLLRILPVCQLL